MRFMTEHTDKYINKQNCPGLCRPVCVGVSLVIAEWPLFSARCPRPAAATRHAGNECVVLSVVFPSPDCYWFGPVRPQLLPLALLLLATRAAHTGLEHERDWRAVGHESGKEKREGGEEFEDLERANGGGV